MFKVREATPNDVVVDVATKAWYNTYLNIYAASINELLAASYNEQHLKETFRRTTIFSSRR